MVVYGRRYHKTATGESDISPNDEQQQEQLDLYHEVYTRAMSYNRGEKDKRLFFVPPISDDKRSRILDVGTGTGIWAIDVAEAFPSAEVVGFDITPIQPTWVPANLKFEVEDVANNWTYPDSSFDLIHVRSMQSIVPDWTPFLSQCYRKIKPGGYIQVYCELPRLCTDDDTIPNDYPVVTWLDSMQEGLKKFGRGMLIDTHIESDIKNAGFEDVTAEFYKVPVGPWPKDLEMKQIGAMFLVGILQGIEGWTTITYTQALGKSVEETEEEVLMVKSALRDKKVHSYMKFMCAYGRKPVA